MSLRKQGEAFLGDSQTDLVELLDLYSRANGYAVQHTANAVCKCSGRTFQLSIDDEEGVAVRKCGSCDHEHPLGDSAEYLEDAELEQCECPCGGSSFELTVGVSLYEGSEAVRWLYVACRCIECSVVGCYGDWKNEHDDYRQLLANV